MIQNSIFARISQIAQVIVPLNWLAILPFLFHRELFDFSDSTYSKLGYVSLLLFSLFFFILVEGLSKKQSDDNPTVIKRVFDLLISVYFPVVIITLIISLAIALDPWLRTSLVLRMIELIGYFAIVGGLVFYIVTRGKFSNLMGEKSNAWSEVGRLFSKRLPKMLLIGSIIIIGFYFRLENIGNFSPTVDEFPHFRNAIYILEGTQVEYSRAYWTVTMPVAISFKLFGISETTGRVPMAILNMLATIPLYFFMKRFGQWIAIFALFLYAVNPSIITMGQLTRDYAPAPIFIFWVYFLTTDLLEAEISSGFRKFIRDQKWKILILFLIFVFIFLDQKSISGVVIANFAVFTLVFLFKALREYENGRKKLFTVIGVGLFVLAGLLFSSKKFQLDGIFLVTKYWEVLITNRFANWSYFIPWVSFGLLIYILFVLVLYFFPSKQKVDHVLFYILLVFIGLMVYSTFFLFTGELSARMRYYVVFVYYLLPVTAIVSQKLVNWLPGSIKSESVYRNLAFATMFFLLFINLPALKSIFEFRFGQNPISNSPHYDYSVGYEYLETHFRVGEVVVSDQIHKYDLIRERFLPEVDVINLKPFTEFEMTFDDLVLGASRGWVVKSKNNGLKPHDFKFETFTLESYDFEFVGIFSDDIAIWKFHKQE